MSGDDCILCAQENVPLPIGEQSAKGMVAVFSRLAGNADGGSQEVQIGFEHVRAYSSTGPAC
jgi:hypothetical protein